MPVGALTSSMKCGCLPVLVNFQMCGPDGTGCSSPRKAYSWNSTVTSAGNSAPIAGEALAAPDAPPPTVIVCGCCGEAGESLSKIQSPGVNSTTPCSVWPTGTVKPPAQAA